MTSIKDMVTGGRQVRFVRYRDRELWYATDDGFEFPVPVADIGTATFLARDKALLFMRYIRRHIQSIEQARSAAAMGGGMIVCEPTLTPEDRPPTQDEPK